MATHAQSNLSSIASVGGARAVDGVAAPSPGPRHVAIIMDGNGRWAKARGLPRVAVRNIRRDGMEALKKAEKDHKISQDEHRQKSDEVQKLTDRYVKQVDDSLAHKEKEIKTV